MSVKIENNLALITNSGGGLKIIKDSKVTISHLNCVKNNLNINYNNGNINNLNIDNISNISEILNWEGDCFGNNMPSTIHLFSPTMAPVSYITAMPSVAPTLGLWLHKIQNTKHK